MPPSAPMPQQSTPEAFRLFIALYNATFGTHPASHLAFGRQNDPLADQEQHIWREVIDEIPPCYFRRVIDAMEFAQRDLDRMAKPTLAQLRAAWHGVRPHVPAPEAPAEAAMSLREWLSTAEGAAAARLRDDLDAYQRRQDAIRKAREEHGVCGGLAVGDIMEVLTRKERKGR